MPDVTVRASAIHGRGVFAERPFRKGETVLTWSPQELTAKDYALLAESERRYVVHVDGKALLMGEPERYVNHSCDANTAPQNRCDVAVRDIAAGEEITGDYSPLCPDDSIMTCACGSPNCKGVIRQQL